ncbi:MAG: hypothetical protein MHM6MM_001887 [Cercozoa sp. M6MM]
MATWRLKLQEPVPAELEKFASGLDELEQKMNEAVNESHRGRRKDEATWPVHYHYWRRNRWIYEKHYVLKEMSASLYKYLVRCKVADGPLISKWRKPGYERLCSLSAVNRKTNFGTVSHCRVPLRQRAKGNWVPSRKTGCISCASGDGGPIWWFSKGWREQFEGSDSDSDNSSDSDDPEVSARIEQLKRIRQQKEEQDERDAREPDQD